MKKIFTLIAVALMLGAATVNAQSMKVTKTDGTIYDFPVEEISKVEFIQGDGSNKENGYEFVDLGLPSGTKWAKCNVGASAPEQAGDYFAWGEVTPKESYSVMNYKYGSGQAAEAGNEDSYDGLKSLTKYNVNPALGEVDNLYELEPEDDAAQVNMGGAWHMPSEVDLQELIDNCYFQKAKINGVSGVKVTGPNGNYIFLPNVGLRYNEIVMFNDVAMKWGFYWTSSLAGSDNTMACYLYSEGTNVVSNSFRFYGQSVRAVFKK